MHNKAITVNNICLVSISPVFIALILAGVKISFAWVHTASPKTIRHSSFVIRQLLRYKPLALATEKKELLFRDTQYDQQSVLISSPRLSSVGSIPNSE